MDPLYKEPETITEEECIAINNENDLMESKKIAIRNRLDEFANSLHFKGKAIRFYNSGKHIYFKTTKHLYQVLPKKKDKTGFRLKIMRIYGID